MYLVTVPGQGEVRDGAANEKAKDEEVMVDEVMELRSVCSEEGKEEEEEEEMEEEEKENRAPPENREEEERGVKKRRSAAGSGGSSSAAKGGRGSGSHRDATEEVTHTSFLYIYIFIFWYCDYD